MLFSPVLFFRFRAISTMTMVASLLEVKWEDGIASEVSVQGQLF